MTATVDAVTEGDVVPVLALRGVSKRFGAIQALSDVGLDLRAGEVHALIGENGAGKSTLIKIITGLYRADSGEVFVDGESVDIHSPAAAQQHGVAAVYQEPAIFPDLTVAENIFIGHRDRGRLVRWRALNDDAAEVLATLDIDLDPRAPASMLTVGEQQAVEIAKAMSLDVRVLIMDEPTSALSAHEVEQLFRQVDRLRRAGVAILFISHRLAEVFTIADRISVFRDGRHISTRASADAGEEQIVREMVGRDLGEFFVRTRHQPGEVALKVSGLARRGRFEGVDFDVRRGEVLGLAGLVGAGRTDIALALFGVAPADGGTIEVDGQELVIDSPRTAMKAGIAYLTEDRRKLGLNLPQSVAANVTLPVLHRYTNTLRLIDRAAERRTAMTFRDQLNIRTPDVDTPVGNLSGGNQQKTVLARWLNVEPSILILDEPTRGIDIGAKAEVHRLIDHLARDGLAVVLISSDLPEVLAMSDRIIVMREGRAVHTLQDGDWDQERVMTAAVGIR